MSTDASSWITKIVGVMSESDAIDYIAQNRDSIVVFDNKTGRFLDSIFGVPLRPHEEVIEDLASGKLSEQ